MLPIVRWILGLVSATAIVCGGAIFVALISSGVGKRPELMLTAEWQLAALYLFFGGVSGLAFTFIWGQISRTKVARSPAKK